MPKTTPMSVPSRDVVEDAVRRAFLEGHALRREDAQKVRELEPLLAEIARALPRHATDPFTLVDACAGKSALGLLTAALLLAPRGGTWRMVALERDERRSRHGRDAAARLGVTDGVELRCTDVEDVSAWPQAPDVVVALHACGRASDVVIDRAVAVSAKRLLLVPCCYAGGPRHDGAAGDILGQAVADAWTEAMPLPRHGLVGRRFAAALIDAERTLRLEASGYETEVIELFGPTVSPHNLLWRARRVREPTRMAHARAQHEALVAGRLDREG